MKIEEIREAIARIGQAADALEEAYIDNGGEVTEETEAMEQEIGLLRDLIAGDGIDTLGRWLKGKEDAKAALKAEKASIQRQMDAVDRTIAYIKEQLYIAIRACGLEKAKGSCYSFTPYTSSKTSVNTERLRELYLERARQAVAGAGIPAWVGVTLTASASLVPEGEPLPDVFEVTTADTVKFLKPRNVKDGE